MFSFFSYLRRAARDAVLGGVSDALEELDPAGNAVPPANLERLRGLAASEAKALPAAKDDEDETPKGRRNR